MYFKIPVSAIHVFNTSTIELLLADMYLFNTLFDHGVLTLVNSAGDPICLHYFIQLILG